jgi:hypothetical protein
VNKEIRLPSPHPKFRARLAGGLRRPGHPGTAVRIAEDLYEVVAAERFGGEWVYRLEPWPDQETIRAYVAWNEGAEREFLAGLRDDRHRRQKSFLAWSVQAFLGFLPAEKQERLFQPTGLDPARASLWSAALETLVAAAFALPFLLNFFSAGMAGLGRSIPAWAGMLACLVMAEGVFRLATVLATGEPIGSLALVLLDLRPRSEGPGPEEGDEILEIGDVLNIVSPVPKVWLERAGGLIYRGEPYRLEDSAREKRKYSYRFRKGGAGFPVLDPEIEKLRNRSSDLSYIFAPMWGFLPAAMQEKLEFYGRYRPRPYTALSIGVNCLAALALAGPGLKSMSLGVFTIWSLARLAVGVALFAESALRLLRIVWDGRATGSFLGVLVKPLYRHVIEERPAPRPSRGS